MHARFFFLPSQPLRADSQLSVLLMSPLDGSIAFVFVHGFLGFDRIRFLRTEIGYFRALRRHLADFPFGMFFPALPPVGRIEQRAETLAACLAEIQAENLFLIGHSMGGLDCRYLISHLDPQKRVKYLATVATPHRGTPLAQCLLRGKGFLPWISRHLIMPGLVELTPWMCERFNQKVQDRPDVCYQSYAGCRPVHEMPPWFQHWSRIIAYWEGPNDSQVSVCSARWGEFKGCLRADHLELAGWNFSLPLKRFARPFDHVALYREIMTGALKHVIGG